MNPVFKPLFSVAIVPAWVLLNSAPHAVAQPLPSAEYLVGTGTSFGDHDSHSGHLPSNLHSDWNSDYREFINGQWVSTMSYSIQAQAEAFGGLQPQAIASAEAHGIASPTQLTFSGGATASVSYSVRIVPTAPPPNGPVVIPIKIHVIGHVNGNGTVTVRVLNGFFFHMISIPNGTQDFDLIETYYVSSDDPAPIIPVELYANATAHEFRGPGWPHSSQALADPIFEMDQTEFDAMMGAESFTLANYFAFEYCPNLIDFIPECDSIDFNNDTSFFDPQDIDAFLSVYGEGPCIPEEAACNDIDFNNDQSVFDPCDIDAFLTQFGEGPCTFCGV